MSVQADGRRNHGGFLPRRERKMVENFGKEQHDNRRIEFFGHCSDFSGAKYLVDGLGSSSEECWNYSTDN